MNSNNINKLKLLLMGLENRFTENISIFKHINYEFISGLKKFKGEVILKDTSVENKFNGIKKTTSINELFSELINQCSTYDAFSLTYSERGEVLLITCDNKNVSMKTIDLKDDESPSSPSSKEALSPTNTSTLLKREYYIKVDSASNLLKELGIMSKDGKIKNDKIRKYNQIDHYVELLDDILNKLPNNRVINILDCGCGKSYLSFVLNYYLTEVKRRKCHFIGIDYSEAVIDTCKTMASNLGYRNMEFHAEDINNFKPNTNIDMVLSLHACDTATDMALALGINLNAEIIVAVPCCHKELLNQYSYSPLKNILDHGVFKSRFADILTDGMRALMLKAKGYDVSVLEYISPLETPKNLMIKAIKVTDENSAAMDEYINLMSSLNVYPTLYALLNQW